jgi:hypothetical protein
MAAVLTGASQRSRFSTQVRCPGSQAYQKRCMTIPSGATTWQSDPSWSLTSPTRSNTTRAKVKPSQSGHLREATRAPPSSAKSQYGGPPTASIPKTRDQPEEANSKRSRPAGNNASTGRSPVPPTRQQIRGATSDRQHTLHLASSSRRQRCRTDSTGRVVVIPSACRWTMRQPAGSLLKIVVTRRSMSWRSSEPANCWP